MLELAACAMLLLSLLGGAVQFGYTFYIYNQLVTAVANGGKYAARRTYRGKDVEKGAAAIRNLVVYGDPHPEGDAVPVVPNLKPENVQVKWKLSQSGAPAFVDLSIVNHRIDAVFGGISISGRPSVEFPYLGRYAPAEVEPWGADGGRIWSKQRSCCWCFSPCCWASSIVAKSCSRTRR